MPMNPVNMRPRSSGGKGGLFGKIFGGLAGLLAAPFTGGMSIPAAIGAVGSAMGAGSLVGSTIGNVADPYKEKLPGGPSPLENQLKIDPDAQVATLKNAQSLIMEDPNMDGPMKESLISPISQSIDKLNQRIRRV